MKIKTKIVSFVSLLLVVFFGVKVIGYSAKAVCIYDVKTGKLLYGYNENVAMSPASITKIVTAITALEMGNENEFVTVDSRAANTEGSSIYLKAGEKILLIDLLYGLMLHSGNDAAMAIAYHFGYDDFIKEMNEVARFCLCENTNFENPSGLDGKNHHVTALDMAKITAYAMKNQTFAKIVSTKNTTLKSDREDVRYLKNHNKLLWQYEYCVGVKTGFTKRAGRTLVSASKKDDRLLICVTLSDPDDWNDHIQLYNEYF